MSVKHVYYKQARSIKNLQSAFVIDSSFLNINALHLTGIEEMSFLAQLLLVSH